MTDEYDHSSYWIGIDWGTTNCTAAIYCPTLGRSKWMRLSLQPRRNNETPQHTIHNVAMEHHSPQQQQQQRNHKVGRIIPSVLLFATTQFLDEYCCGCTEDPPEWHDDPHIRIVRLQQRHQPLLASSTKTDYYIWENVTDLLSPQNNNTTDLWVCVGAAAESLRNELLVSVVSQSISEEEVDRAIITSAKRTILKELSSNTTTSNSSNNSSHTNIVIPVHPLDCIDQNDDDHTERQCCCQLDAITVVAILLRSIRRAAHNYLQQPKVQKKLGLGESLINVTTTPLYSCCIGVPVMASYQYRTLLQHAATRAGYQTTITCTESTAAAMAYGLSFVVHPRTTTPTPSATTEDSPSSSIPHQPPEKRILPVQTIFVFDMGGGTTDVTIAQRGAVSAASLPDDVVEDDDTDFQVCVTVGNDQLGGDDMDQAILNLVQTKIHDQGRLNQTTINTPTIENAITPLPKQQQLLRQCRLAKLALCGDIDHDIHPLDSYVIPLQDDASTHIKSVTISQKDFELAMAPIIQSTRDLIQSALDQYEIKRDTKLPTTHDPQSNNFQEGGPATGIHFTASHIDEVILIGGASRVPYIRHLLRDIFIANSTASSVKELCTSINAMSAVAQGCSVSAVIYSGRVPIHEIKSAFMLDTLPYSIGVLTTTRTTTRRDNGSDSQKSTEPQSNHNDNIVDDREDEANNYIEILSRGTSLPAAGYSTFILSDMLQKGITVLAVEQIPISSSSLLNEKNKHSRESKKQNGINVPRYQYNIIGEFTFLLHRLSKDQIHRLREHENGIRTVDVGMTLKESGEFVVSIFDKNDPDHIRKKQWYQRNKAANEGRTKDRMMHRPTSPKRDHDDGTADMDNSEPHHPYTFEQMVLMVSCALVFVLYIATKLTFPTTILLVEPSDA